MKRKLFSLAITVLILLSTIPLTYAAHYQGTYNETVTIKSGDTIDRNAVFRGAVIIEMDATVSCGTFHGDVTVSAADVLSILGGHKPALISGGTFYGTINNGGVIKQGDGLEIKAYGNVINSAEAKLTVDSGIYSGTFSGNGTVTNTNGCCIYGGSFTKEVINSGTITGGEYHAKVTNTSTGILGGLLNSAVYYNTVENSGTVSDGRFCSAVNNNYKIIGGSFYAAVTNNHTITNGVFYNIIRADGGTINRDISALVLNGNSYTVMNRPTLKSRVDMSGGKTTFTLPEGTALTVSAEDGSLAIDCPASFYGNLYVYGKLTSNSGSLAAGTGTHIHVYLDASFSGLKYGKFESITRKQYAIEVSDDLINCITKGAFPGETVNFAVNLSTLTKCYSGTTVQVTDSGNNPVAVTDTTAASKQFVMPNSKVRISLQYTVAHLGITGEHRDAKCESDGYDRTYCSMCGTELSRTVIPKTGHQWDEWVYNENEGSNVLKTRTCRVCPKSENAYVEIADYREVRTEDYKATITFHANIKASDDHKLIWIINGKEYEDNGTASYTVAKSKKDYTVKVRVEGVTLLGNTESETETIHIRHGFFDIIGAFFRYLFKGYPVIDQNIIQ